MRGGLGLADIGDECDRAVRQVPSRGGAPRMGWYEQANFGDKKAKVKESGQRTEVVWGGSEGNKKGDKHGHLVSNDGVNASYVRQPGGKVVVDDRHGRRR